MQLDTQLHLGLGRRLSLHKLSFQESATLSEAVPILHKNQATTTASLFDLI